MTEKCHQNSPPRGKCLWKYQSKQPAGILNGNACKNTSKPKSENDYKMLTKMPT